MKRILTAVLLLGALGCGNSTSIQTDLTGTWKTQIGELVILATVSQNGSNLSGTVTFTDGSGTRDGTANGSVHGADVSLSLQATAGGSVDVSGVLQNESRISARANSTNFTPTISDAVALLIRQ